MTETEVLRQFFDAWSEAEKLKAPGRPSAEAIAARELLKTAAEAVRTFKPGAVDMVIPSADPALAEYRLTQQQVAAIPPKDTRGTPSKNVTIVNG